MYLPKEGGEEEAESSEGEKAFIGYPAVHENNGYFQHSGEKYQVRPYLGLNETDEGGFKPSQGYEGEGKEVKGEEKKSGKGG